MSGRCDTCGEVGSVWCGECAGPHPDDAVATREGLRSENARLRERGAALEEAGSVLAEYVEEQPFSLAKLTAIEAWRAALANGTPA